MFGPRTPSPGPAWPPSRRPTPHPRIPFDGLDPRPGALLAPVARRAPCPPDFCSMPYDHTVCAIPPCRGTWEGDASLDPESANTQATRGLGASYFDLPASFTLFNRTHFHRHSHMYLATSKDQPLYRVSPEWDRVLLHSGPGPNDAILATLKHKSILDSSHGQVTLAHGMQGTIPLRSSYGFAINVPAAAPSNHDTYGRSGTRIEAFEWRRSRGPAVKLLGHGSGYKLVRSATDAGNGCGEIATDGGEVVAVLALERPWQ